MSAKSAPRKKYTRVHRTRQLTNIISYAKGKGTSMTAATATEYSKVHDLPTIKKLIDHDVVILRAVAKTRVAIPKKLAEESVKQHKKGKK